MTHIQPITDERCPACGQERNPVPQSETLQFCPRCRLPHVIVAGKYQIQKRLAEGGCGILYLARHTQLTMEPMRVLKFLKPEYFAHAHAAQRFAREVEVTAALSQRNQHIVRVYDDFGAIPELGHFYVMEYLRGEDLNARISREMMPLDSILHIVGQILDAMIDAHEAQVIHRDLKPHNVYLIKRKEDPHFVKVIDFGIARGISGFANTGITQGVLGTPEYMAPEQCTGQNTDQRTDIYAIGMILYEMLVGHTPFLPPNASGISPMNMAIAQMMEQPRPPSQVRPDRHIPPALEALIMRAIEKTPEARFPSADAMKSALAKADPYQRTTPELRGVGWTDSHSNLPSGDNLAAASQASPLLNEHLTKTTHPDTLEPSKTQGLRSSWLIAAGIILWICGGSVWYWLWNKPPAAKVEPKQATPRPQPVRRGLALTPPRQPRQRAIPRPAVVPTKPIVLANPKPPPRRRRLRRKKRKRQLPRRASTSVCPPAPAGMHWLPLQITPPDTNIGAQLIIAKAQNGQRCILFDPKKDTQIGFTLAGYEACVVTLKPHDRKLAIRMQRVADQLGGTALQGSKAGCRR